MTNDLDPLDDIFLERAANNARAGGKFQPKTKPRPRKQSSAPVPSARSFQVADVADNELAAVVGPSLVSPEELKNNEESAPVVHSSLLVSSSFEHVVIGERLGNNVSLHSDVLLPDNNGSWRPATGKLAGESADIFFGLESLDDFYSQSTTATAVSAVSRSPHRVDPSVQLGNEFVAPSPVDNDAEGSLAPLEMLPTVHASDTRNAASGAVTPSFVSSLDDSTVRASNTFSPNTNPEVAIPQDPLTHGEPLLSNSDGGLHIDTAGVEMEELDYVPRSENLDNLYELTEASGQQTGKFLPKPKFQIGLIEEPGSNTSYTDGVESLPCFQDDLSIPSEGECIKEGSIPAFQPNHDLDFPSLGFGDSTYELPENEKPTDHMEASSSDASVPGENPEDVPELADKSEKGQEGKGPMISDESPERQNDLISGQGNESGRATRKPRKHINACELVDEDEEADDDCNFAYKCNNGSHVDGDCNNDGECEVANETRKNGRALRKTKKSVSQKQKPVKKRKKVNKVADLETKEPPKKFSHSTRRRRRLVDRTLLETPEDEIDVQKLQIRDLILLAEHRERMSSKEGNTMKAPSTNQRASNSFPDYDEDEAFAAEQGGSSSNQNNPTVQESTIFTNYQSFTNRTPRSRWSKQDTELFYKAVRQFGSDISMIQQLFPDRTRTQVKLKYKNEERQHPLRLHEALTNRAKDHSHFELVIERLQQLAAQEKQSSFRDDSVGLTGDEEAENNEVNEEVAKPEEVEKGDVESMEPDASEVQDPVKPYDSDDDMFRWSQYKSEL
ncbi:uncharacterized protein LOC127799588 isoform X2 [Diospyros lotus]|uniref:uncharacterized protein LOC127799588 isoform X2 n=1 Tax=Diospyros lotus TaxID=55363 RepID=UPI002257D9D5|nr:uncharacterized protein LOC127799588 isoform X2 [Diospyros lotus]